MGAGQYSNKSLHVGESSPYTCAILPHVIITGSYCIIPGTVLILPLLFYGSLNPVLVSVCVLNFLDIVIAAFFS